MTKCHVTFDGYNDLVDAAHEYAERGWHVFPMTFREDEDEDGHYIKQPLTKPTASNRQRWGATTDHEVITTWARRFGKRWHGIGIPTGEASGLMVLDVDPQNGGDESALPGPLPPTLSATTVSGGRHYVYEWSPGVTNKRGSLPTGVDMRGEGGYVVVAPSLNPHSGGGYAWADEDAEPAPAPDWLLAAVCADASPASAPSTVQGVAVGKPTPRDVKVACAALDSDCEELAGLTQGQDGGRNNALNRMAVRLHRMVAARRLDAEEVRERLLDAGMRAGLSEKECRDTLKSAFGSEAAQAPSLGPDGERGVFAGAGGDDVIGAIRQLFLAADDKRSDYLASVMSDEDVLALKDPEFVIDHWIPRGVYTVLYGEPGVKKTFALLGMYLAVRRGTRWQDHGTRKGSVLLFEGEGAAQLKPRLRAWTDRYPLRDDQSMAPGGVLEEFVDLTRPEGVAAIVRTVRGFEQLHDTTVQMVIIDPLVEFMTGEENGEGMDSATRGLRALAMYLDIGVVVGHHTNASGERARGADFHRMRAGAFVQMEDLGDDQLGLWQGKQKNAEQVALIVEAVEHQESLVLEWLDNLPVRAYVMQKESERKRRKEVTQGRASDEKRQKASDLLLAAVRATPGLSRTKLVTACLGHGIGRTVLETTLDQMTDPNPRLDPHRGGGKTCATALRKRCPVAPTRTHPGWDGVGATPPPTPAAP